MSSRKQSDGLLDTPIRDPAARHGEDNHGKEDVVDTATQKGALKSPSAIASTRIVEEPDTKSDIPLGRPEKVEGQEAKRAQDAAGEPGSVPTSPKQGLTTMQVSAENDHCRQESSQDTRPEFLRPMEPNPENYLDPTPKTPRLGVSPVREPQDEPKVTGEVNPDSEIQSIMEQFGNGDDIKENENPWGDTKMLLSAPVDYPPRRSSLAASEATKLVVEHDERPGEKSVSCRPLNERDEQPRVPVEAVIRPSRNSSLPQAARLGAIQDNVPPSPGSPMLLSKAPLPAPDPEPDLPFDFHRFLEQLRDKSADPVAKYLRSFLIEFGRKQWMVHEQVKLVNDFLTFITNKMARCAVWRDVNDAEFDNAKEGMEKLVMNRLYAQTFSPAIPPPSTAPTSKGKRKPFEKTLEPGRRGQHQEDIERDEILGQKVRIYGWIQEEHLDIPAVSDNGRRFLVLAQQELLKIKNYRAPRDKIICVLNCCKVIFGILKHSKSSDTSADSFVPLLIYVVLHANPDHLVSNVQYILRFRNQDKLGGEAGYYLSSLMGAIQFIENLDRTSLTVSDQEFEKNVEVAVSAIAEKHQDEMPRPAPPRPQPPRAPTTGHLSEKSGPSMPQVIPRNSIDAEYSSPRRSASVPRKPGDQGDGGSEENTAVSGLLRTIQKPLSSISRIFGDDAAPGTATINSRTLPEPQLPQPRLDPSVFQPPRLSEDMDGAADGLQSLQIGQRPPNLPSKPTSGEVQAGKLSAEDAAARQASSEAAEAQRIQRAEHHSVVE